MGRLWLALAIAMAIAAPALATVPHVPSAPTITSAYLEIGDPRTSAGLYDVELLQLTGSFDRYTSTVRIRLHTASGDQVIETTPDQLTLVRPKLLSPVGPVTLEIISSNGRLDSEPTRVAVVPQRHHPRSGGAEVFGFVMLFGAAMGLLLMFGVLLALRAAEVKRERIRRDTEPTGLPNPAAEEYIRIVALRALLARRRGHRDRRRRHRRGCPGHPDLRRPGVADRRGHRDHARDPCRPRDRAAPSPGCRGVHAL